MIKHRKYIDGNYGTIGPDLNDSVKMRIAYRYSLRHVDAGIRPYRQELIDLLISYQLS